MSCHNDNGGVWEQLQLRLQSAIVKFLQRTPCSSRPGICTRRPDTAAWKTCSHSQTWTILTKRPSAWVCFSQARTNILNNNNHRRLASHTRKTRRQPPDPTPVARSRSIPIQPHRPPPLSRRQILPEKIPGKFGQVRQGKPDAPQHPTIMNLTVTTLSSTNTTLAGVAQSVERVALNNSKEINLKVVGSSPTFGYSYITSSTEQLFFCFFAGRSLGR